MKRSRLSRRIAEQISVAIQARLGCSVCLAAHVHAARAAGLDDGDIALAMAGHAADPAAAELVTFALDVLSEPASIDEQRIAVLRTHGHDDRTLLDVLSAENDQAAARLQLAQARTDWLLARLQLATLSGRPGDVALQALTAAMTDSGTKSAD